MACRATAHPLTALLLAAWVCAGLAASDVGGLLQQGRRLFQAGEFHAAAQALEQAVDADPSCARCWDWLGRAYGRMAETASWLKAAHLARQARKAFERAVQLDPDDPDALSDLIAYYRAAPAILGGSEAKARALAERLAALSRTRQAVTGTRRRPETAARVPRRE